MFISGADQTKAELRVPSIKGALRFWWRAINYEEDPKELLKKESNIFGSSDQKVGQSKVKMYISSQNIETEKQEVPFGQNDWEHYVGYGLTDSKDENDKKIKRTFIKEGGTFNIELISKDKKTLEEILPALKVFGLIGGLGSRSRRGWGSMTLLNIKKNDKEEWKAPDSKDGYNKEVKNIFEKGKIITVFPEYTAFSLFSTYSINDEPYNNSNMAHRDISEGYKKYLDMFSKKGKRANKKPAKEEFGLPRKGFGNEKDRRSSPLFMHIHKVGTQYYPMAFTMPARFNESKYEPVGKYQYIEEFAMDFLHHLEGN